MKAVVQESQMLNRAVLVFFVVFAVVECYSQEHEQSTTNGDILNQRNAKVEGVEHSLNEQERIAVNRSLKFLARDGERWINERGCVSCHHVPMMIWAHNEAKRAGMEIDNARLNSTTNWAFTSMLAERDQFGGADSISQMLLGRDRKSPWRRKPPRHFKTVDPFETLFEILLERLPVSTIVE